MPRLLLTERVISTLTSPDKPQTDYFDVKCTGLALRVTHGGKKAWSFMYTSPRDGKRARMKLGTHPATNLNKARRKAIGAREIVEDGFDPRDHKRKSVKKRSAATEFSATRPAVETESLSNFRSRTRSSAKRMQQIGTIKRGNYIREWRLFRRIGTQKKLADLSGMTRPTITRLESNKQPYRQEQLEKISAVLRCRPAELIDANPNGNDYALRKVCSQIPEDRKEQALKILSIFLEEP